MNRRFKIGNQIFANYIYENDDVQELCQEVVFKWYLDKHENDYADLFYDIREEIELLESLELYERCKLLKDIIDRFE